jgi:hypothetical protein
MYQGTLFVVEPTAEQINKAVLDLLKKINDVAGKLDTLTANYDALLKETRELRTANSTG